MGDMLLIWLLCKQSRANRNRGNRKQGHGGQRLSACSARHSRTKFLSIRIMFGPTNALR
jgi:hypothetical protein